MPADLFDSSEITRADKRKCLKREIGFRERVFPRRVADRKMDQSDADRELAIMRAIQKDYEGEAPEAGAGGPSITDKGAGRLLVMRLRDTARRFRLEEGRTAYATELEEAAALVERLSL
jgi:hypothetical protein